MVIAPEKSIEELDKEFVSFFSELKVGDRRNIVVEISEIKMDEKNEHPHWFLYYLFDGMAMIRAFGRAPNEMKIGTRVIVEIEVHEGKIFNGKPQFNYQIHAMEKIEESGLAQSHLLEKFEYKAVLRKRELQDLPDGTRVKLFTRILNLHPINGERDKFQKILVVDVENKPISLWFNKENFPVFEALNEEEYFILKATVKTIRQNQTARFLSFETLLRGEVIYKDQVTKRFVEERIRHHSHQLLSYIELRKSYSSEDNLSIDLLLLMLKSFQADMFQD